MSKSRASRLSRLFWIIAGLSTMILGLLGMMIPVLPTVPFLLVAAFCFAQSSDRLSDWLLNNRLFGPYLKNYRERRGMSLRSKVFTLTALWLSIGLTTLFYVSIWWGRLLLLVLALAVTVHVLTLRTLTSDSAADE